MLRIQQTIDPVLRKQSLIRGHQRLPFMLGETDADANQQCRPWLHRTASHSQDTPGRLVVVILTNAIRRSELNTPAQSNHKPYASTLHHKAGLGARARILSR